MIETKDIVGWILGIVPPLVTFMYNRIKNKGDIKITLDYERQKIISNKPSAVVDLPEVEQIIDPLLVEVTLTNTGKETVIIDKFGVVVDGQKVILEYCTPFYFTSTSSDDTVQGGFSELQYISKVGEKLGKIEAKHKVEVQIKASLFLHDVKNIFVIDTLGKKWSTYKKSLDTFYTEFDKNNPVRDPYLQGGNVPNLIEFNKNIQMQIPSDRGRNIILSEFFKKYRSEIASFIIGIVLLTGTPWWWNWLITNKPIKEEVPNKSIASQSMSNQTSQPSIAPINSKPVPKKADEEIIRVDRGKTGVLFEGAVKVSVIGISFEGDPLRHKVTAKIDGFNMSKSIEKADVGTSVTLQNGQTVYEVRLHETSTFTADFSGTVRQSK